MDVNNLPPVPTLSPPDTSRIVVRECEERLLCASELLDGKLLFSPQYYLQQIPGETSKIYMRETVAHMLCEAQRRLPAGYRLLVFDAWRPVSVQKSLFSAYCAKLSLNPLFSNLSKEQLCQKAREFVSYPSADPLKPFVHSTGGAVDLSIVNERGEALDMGTHFDEFTPAAYAASFENSHNLTVRNNRRLLHYVMTSVGFSGYYAEWWHFDYGDPFWASAVGKPAIYGGIYA